MTQGRREVQRLDAGWLFYDGELSPRPRRATPKAGQSWSAAVWEATAETPGWTKVRVPHDARIGKHYVEPDDVDPNADHYPYASQGFLPPCVGYYRRTFEAPDRWLGQRVHLHFGGVMRDSTTWVNGHCLGTHASGYTSFEYDVTDVVRFGDEGPNVVLIRFDTSEPEGWWYEGAGLYRDVELVVCNPVHVADGGVTAAVTLGDGSANIDVSVEVVNDGPAPVLVTAQVHLDDDGTLVAIGSAVGDIEPGAPLVLSVPLSVDSPRLWDVDDPHRHRLTCALEVGATQVDEVVAPIGLRSAELRAGQGFFLNGRRVQLWGVNLHQDFAGVGIAVPSAVTRHRLELVQSLGCNAIRTAHHPPDEHVLEWCDRLGILVIDENRHLDSSAEGLADLAALIRRDRTRACVIAWCLENEELLEGTTMGTRILATLHRAAKRLDPTRPTLVAGCQGFDGDDYWGVPDAVGVNHLALTGTFEKLRATHPAKPLLATEDAVLTSSRGAYRADVERALVSSYHDDLPPWVDSTRDPADPQRRFPQVVWQHVADHPELAGLFLWSGFDYGGEPDPRGWPSVTSHYGAFDLAGFPKDHAWLIRSFLRPEPMVHLLPHWTWPDREGQPIRVMAYTNSDEVALTLNGRPVGRVRVAANTAEWQVAYEPGLLEATAYRAGHAVATAAVPTAGPPVALRLQCERDTIAADGCDVAVVRAAVIDASGQIVPDADDGISWDIEGPASLLGTGSGDPRATSPIADATRQAFHGWSMALVQSRAGSGTVRVTGQARGLTGHSVEIVVR